MKFQRITSTWCIGLWVAQVSYLGKTQSFLMSIMLYLMHGRLVVDLSTKSIAFVLGGAKCVWADLASAQVLCIPNTVVVVNDIGVDYPGKIDHWVSYHSDFLG